MFLVRVRLPVPLRMLYMAALGSMVPFWWFPPGMVPRHVKIACGVTVAIFFEVFNFVNERKS